MYKVKKLRYLFDCFVKRVLCNDSAPHKRAVRFRYIARSIILNIIIWGRCKKHGLTLIPVLITNNMPSKVRDENTHPFPNFNGAAVEVWRWLCNFIYILYRIKLLNMLPPNFPNYCGRPKDVVFYSWIYIYISTSSIKYMYMYISTCKYVSKIDE